MRVNFLAATQLAALAAPAMRASGTGSLLFTGGGAALRAYAGLSSLCAGKGDRLATCSLWTHDLGWECRLLTGGELIATQVCRREADIEAFSATWRKALAEKGWH